MGNHTSSFSLPLEIITDIFLLLPLESVLACKLVSKEWKNVVEDSNFIKRYKADATTLFLDGKILKCVFQKQDKKYYESGQIGSYEKLNCDIDLLLESSNKIACVKTIDGRFLLYDLLSGDKRVVEDAPVRAHSRGVWSFLGFGYDPHEDDYKIIVICKSYERKRVGLTLNESDSKRNLICSYSYNKGDWKHREGFEDREYEWSWSSSENRGFAVNGSLYWIIRRSNSRKRIAGLDLSTYEMTHFKLPPLSEYDEICQFSNLTSFKEKLCCFVDGAQVQLDVWVMEESWKMLLRIGYSEVGFPWFEKIDMRIYQDKDRAEIVVFIHNQGNSLLFGYDHKQSYVKTLGPKSSCKIIQVGVETLITGLIQCMWPD